MIEQWETRKWSWVHYYANRKTEKKTNGKRVHQPSPFSDKFINFQINCCMRIRHIDNVASLDHAKRTENKNG